MLHSLHTHNRRGKAARLRCLQMQVGVARTDVSVDRQRVDGTAHVNGHTMANGLARTGCVKVGVKEFGLTRLIPAPSPIDTTPGN